MSRVRRAALALLPDADATAWARRFILDLDERFGTGWVEAGLPPHVSLKQPFEARDVAAVETFAADLAARTAPVPVRFGRLATWRPKDAPSTAWISVEDAGRLDAMHRALNRDLPVALGAAAEAPFDGDYVPHLTVAHGGDPAAYDAIERELGGTVVDVATRLERLQVFVYREEHGAWTFDDLVGFPLRG